MLICILQLKNWRNVMFIVVGFYNIFCQNIYKIEEVGRGAQNDVAIWGVIIYFFTCFRAFVTLIVIFDCFLIIPNIWGVLRTFVEDAIVEKCTWKQSIHFVRLSCEMQSSFVEVPTLVIGNSSFKRIHWYFPFFCTNASLPTTRVNKMLEEIYRYLRDSDSVPTVSALAITMCIVQDQG